MRSQKVRDRNDTRHAGRTHREEPPPHRVTFLGGQRQVSILCTESRSPHRARRPAARTASRNPVGSAGAILTRLSAAVQEPGNTRKRLCHTGNGPRETHRVRPSITTSHETHADHAHIERGGGISISDERTLRPCPPNPRSWAAVAGTLGGTCMENRFPVCLYCRDLVTDGRHDPGECRAEVERVIARALARRDATARAMQERAAEPVERPRL